MFNSLQKKKLYEKYNFLLKQNSGQGLLVFVAKRTFLRWATQQSSSAVSITHTTPSLKSFKFEYLNDCLLKKNKL